MFFALNRVEMALLQGQRFRQFFMKPAIVKTGLATATAGTVFAAQAVTLKAFCESEDTKPVRKVPTGAKLKASKGTGGGNANQPPAKQNDPVTEFIVANSGFLQNLGLSGFLGACSGIALKRVSREVAAAIGIAFAGLQTLSYLGYITIDYARATKDAQKIADLNNDGKVDAKDLLLVWNKVKDVLGYNLPQAGSFSTGFFLGFYYF